MVIIHQNKLEKTAFSKMYVRICPSFWYQMAIFGIPGPWTKSENLDNSNPCISKFSLTEIKSIRPYFYFHLHVRWLDISKRFSRVLPNGFVESFKGQTWQVTFYPCVTGSSCITGICTWACFSRKRHRFCFMLWSKVSKNIKIKPEATRVLT